MCYYTENIKSCLVFLNSMSIDLHSNLHFLANPYVKIYIVNIVVVHTNKSN